MASFLDKFKLAYESAYWMQDFKNVSIFPKILEKKSNFSEEEKAHLTRKGYRWYVYYDYRNPETGEFERQTPVTLKLNRRFPDFDARLKAFRRLKVQLIEHLSEGNVPNKYRRKKTDKYTIIDALEFALENKSAKVKNTRTIKGYEKSVKAFQDWLKRTGKANYPISEDRTLIVKFLDSLKVSGRTRNNYRSDLSAVYGVLVQHGYIKINPVLSVEKDTPDDKKDPTYSNKQVKDITAYLKENDPVMLMYVYFVSYMFWRPKENCRIRVKDIDFQQRTMTAFIKQGKLKTKLIPEILLEDLKNYLKDASPEDYVFTPGGPGAWETQLDNKRNYFSQRYKKIKEVLGLDPGYTIYSFRHTYITKAYKSILQETQSEEKTIQVLSKITGHTSKAIYEYIHYSDLSLPEDYSRHFKVNL